MKRSIIYFFAGANLAVTICFWWLGSSAFLASGDWGKVLIAFGRLFGLLGELFILTQLVLIGRVRAIEQEFGFDRLNRFHRWLGYGIPILVVLHPAFLSFGYAAGRGVSFLSQLVEFLLYWDDVIAAFLGLGLVAIIVFVSIAVIRRRLRYETWYFTHVLMYVAIALIFTHQVNGADVSRGAAFAYWYAVNFFIFGVVLLYRFLRPLGLYYRHRFYVEKVVRETDTVCSVYIAGRAIESFSFLPGQYANLIFVAKRMWYSHPFSFSAAPNGRYVRFSIKSAGDFTSRIPDLKPGTRVVIDGPLGIFTEQRARKDKFLFIAGGIGITPIRSLIESLRRKGRDIKLLYGNRTERDTAFRHELDEFHIPYHAVYSQEQSGEHESGRIDAEKLRRLVPDIAEREIYLCGPRPMMDFVIGELEKIGVQSGGVHYERFEY